jgi:hypothetical protein
MLAGHSQIAQREQHQHLRTVLNLATVARIHLTELSLDHSEWMFDDRAD